MQLFILVFASLLCSNMAFSQRRPKERPPTPPGTVPVNDTMYVDRDEVTNIDWREYLYYLGIHYAATVPAALPDTLVWNDATYTITISNDTFTSTMSEIYFRHPRFNDHPVVGISYEQALRFCQWRSDRVNELYASLPENKRPFKKVTYRLLYESEWEKIAAGGRSLVRYPYGYDSILTYNRSVIGFVRTFNCKYYMDSSRLQWGSDYPEPFYYHYTSNSSHTYHIIGNVAEMVQEKGIAKGGSFEHLLEDCKILSQQHYDSPQRWLGFRCVAIVEK